MAVIIDTGFLIALRNRGDAHHSRANAVAAQIWDGRHGRAVISDYIVAEVLNFMSRGQARAERVRQMLDEMLGRTEDAWLDLLRIDPETFDASVRLFEGLGMKRGFSFTDCSSVVLARALNAEGVASFDAGFDGVLARLS